jgi:hypothetical protein
MIPSRHFVVAEFTLSMIVTFALPMHAQIPMNPANWDAFQFLIGEWIGDGSGQSGQGNGVFSFSYDLQNRIIVRKSFADYPATQDKPPFRHDDLMIIYYESDTIPRATYFDNEGHVIHYTVTTNDASWVFATNESTPIPNFRLTYQKMDESTLNIAFEVAPPRKPFAPYIKATAHRK